MDTRNKSSRINCLETFQKNAVKDLAFVHLILGGYLKTAQHLSKWRHTVSGGLMGRHPHIVLCYLSVLVNIFLGLASNFAKPTMGLYKVILTKLLFMISFP